MSFCVFLSLYLSLFISIKSSYLSFNDMWLYLWVEFCVDKCHPLAAVRGNYKNKTFIQQLLFRYILIKRFLPNPYQFVLKSQARFRCHIVIFCTSFLMPCYWKCNFLMIPHVCWFVVRSVCRKFIKRLFYFLIKSNIIHAIEW